jgi:galactose mutarotase-like enzyme
MSYRQVNVAGFPAVALRSSEIEIVVIPSLGGKISHLRRLDGREWLWRSEQIPYAVPRRGASYVETADSGGWDECFPTVGSCPMPGRPELQLPDHGELWSLPWESRIYDFAGGTGFTSTARGEILPYEFHREVIVHQDEPVVRLYYRLQHTGDVAFPWIWSAHPLLNVQPGTVLTLPSVHQMKVDAAHGRPEQKGDTIAWPPGGGGGSFVFPEREQWAMKLFGDIGPSGKAMLTDPRKGERLEFSVGSSTVPQIGIWINCHGWAPPGKLPYYNLALEPCIGAPDRLDEAHDQWGLAQTLHPGEIREWSVEVQLPQSEE